VALKKPSENKEDGLAQTKSDVVGPTDAPADKMIGDEFQDKENHDDDNSAV
jgi:hypothetical protein